jgi:hypothetical protein
MTEPKTIIKNPAMPVDNQRRWRISAQTSQRTLGFGSLRTNFVAIQASGQLLTPLSSKDRNDKPLLALQRYIPDVTCRDSHFANLRFYYALSAPKNHEIQTYTQKMAMAASSSQLDHAGQVTS